MTSPTTADTPIGSWLDALAEREPTPGGGAAAALLVATSAALVSMVAVYTTGPKWVDRDARMQGIDTEATKLRVTALALADSDAKAYGAVRSAYALPKQTPREQSIRAEEIERALIVAAEPPVQIGAVAAAVTKLCVELSQQGNPSVISDVAVAASAAQAALDSAIVNIDINRASITDPAASDRLVEAVATLADISRTAADTAAAVRARIGG